MVSREKDMRAAEYVLGVLDPADMRAAESDRVHDPAFAEAVDAWETLLSPLAESGPSVAPDDALRTRIESILDAREVQSPKPVALASQIDALQRALAAWRMAAIGAAAAAAAIAIAWFGGLDMPFRPHAPAERYVAMLKSDTGETGFVVTFDMKDKMWAIRKMAPDPHAQNTYELWAMMENGTTKPPMSLGIVGRDGYTMTPMPAQIDRQMLDKGVKLAISVEPPGGAPEKTAMGPVVFAGELIKLTP